MTFLRSIALAAALAVSAAGAMAQQATPRTPAPPAAEAPPVFKMEDLLKPGPLPENILGKADAPVTIVEYASLTCSHCGTFHNRTLPVLKRDYIDTGKVRLVFRDFPFDVVAMAGTMLSRCSGPDKFFDFTAVLFREQQTWAFSDDPQKKLLELAKSNGFTQETFDACLQRQDIYDGVLAVRKRAHEEFKVDSTPTLFVNGVMYRGALTPEQMDAAIKPFLDKK